jgi:hypothetical protein
MTTPRERASQPEDLARLWVERSFAGDAEGLATLRWGDLALTGTYSADNVGVRAQVARRQPDGTWLRIIDRPEVRRQ